MPVLLKVGKRCRVLAERTRPLPRGRTDLTGRNACLTKPLISLLVRLDGNQSGTVSLLSRRCMEMRTEKCDTENLAAFPFTHSPFPPLTPFTRFLFPSAPCLG
jgi:hypothetical protein